MDLAGGEVDADADVAGGAVGAAPGGQLMGRGLHHVGAELDQQAHLLAQRQELLRRHHAPARMAPAGQGFEAGDGAGVEPHHRLEEGHDLSAANGAAQVRFHG